MARPEGGSVVQAAVEPDVARGPIEHVFTANIPPLTDFPLRHALANSKISKTHLKRWEDAMGLFGKLFKGPEPDMEKSAANAEKLRALFNRAVDQGDSYRLIVGYTEDVRRFNYGFVHGSKTQIGNLIVGWNEATRTIVAVPTVPDLSGYGDPTYYRREEIHKAYRNKYPTDAFIIYPDRKGYIGINAYEWLEDESLYIYLYQKDELEAFTSFFQNEFATK
ncbi:hypothetical protein COLINT_02738 [Collinsella intestinalis DSM 13280]|uniref:Uncharacterized protein n=2 Tax=Collinsella intestinalis TaxID=147207 RepID=C4F9K4_9ACTN|nr:hypothetical protein COLINT_02738 [Collinsella intestinalis DSM 13280]